MGILAFFLCSLFDRTACLFFDEVDRSCVCVCVCVCVCKVCFMMMCCFSVSCVCSQKNDSHDLDIFDEEAKQEEDEPEHKRKGEMMMEEEGKVTFSKFIDVRVSSRTFQVEASRGSQILKPQPQKIIACVR
jgi:hypothetical protein